MGAGTHRRVGLQDVGLQGRLHVQVQPCEDTRTDGRTGALMQGHPDNRAPGHTDTRLKPLEPSSCPDTRDKTQTRTPPPHVGPYTAPCRHPEPLVPLRPMGQALVTQRGWHGGGEGSVPFCLQWGPPPAIGTPPAMGTPLAMGSLRPRGPQDHGDPPTAGTSPTFGDTAQPGTLAATGG